MSLPSPLVAAFLLSVLNLAYVRGLLVALRGARRSVPRKNLFGGLLSLCVLVGLVPLIGLQVGWAAAALVLPAGLLAVWALSLGLAPVTGLAAGVILGRSQDRTRPGGHTGVVQRPAGLLLAAPGTVRRPRPDRGDAGPRWAGPKRYRLHCRSCGVALTEPLRELQSSLPAMFYDGRFRGLANVRVCRPREGAFWRSTSTWKTEEGACVLAGVDFGTDGEVLLLSQDDLKMEGLRPEQLLDSGGCCGYYGAGGPNTRCRGCGELVLTWVEDCFAPSIAAARLREVELRPVPPGGNLGFAARPAAAADGQGPSKELP